MRICIVTSSGSPAKPSRAGRRYELFAQAGQRMGVSIDRLAMDEASTRMRDYDLHVLTEIDSTDAVLLASRIRRLGGRVAVDVAAEGHAVSASALSTIAEDVDFYLCATPALADSVRAAIGPDAECLHAPDPAPAFDANRLAHLLHMKLWRAAASRKIDLLWFDCGSDGRSALADLVAQASDLAGLALQGWRIGLTVVLDRAGHGAESLRLLRRLPIPYDIKAWSPESERVEIEQHFACFLPAGGRPRAGDSRLGAAIAALSGGSQVVAPAMSPDESIGGFVLDGPSALALGLSERRLPLRLDNVDDFVRLVAVEANMYQCVEAMLLGMDAARPSPRRSGPDYGVGVIHIGKGRRKTSGAARRRGELSVKSPLCGGEGDYDVRIDLAGGRLRILVEHSLVTHIPARLGWLKQVQLGSRLYRELDPMPFQSFFGSFAFWHLPGGAAALAARGPIVDATRAVCSLLFPDTRFLVADATVPGAPARPAVA